MVETQDIKKGYKQTALGVIPEEWEVKQLGDVVLFLDGKRKPIKDSDRAKMQGKYPYYGASGIIDYVNDYIFNEELILLGEDGANIINRSTPLAFKVSGKIWVNNHAHVLKPKNEYSIGYLTEALESIRYEKYNTGTAQPKLNKEVCSKILVPLPPLPEQRKIAEILSTWDEAIAQTKALIEQLKLRNKGLAQQLLTGKKRLKGFSGEWKEVKAEYIFKNHTDKSHNGDLEVLSATQENGVIPRSQNNIDIKFDPTTLHTYKKVEKGDFVISLRSFQGGIEFSEYEGLVSPAYTVLKEVEPISKTFYRIYLKTETFINRLNTIIYGIRDGKQIGYKDFSTLKIPHPSIEEQEGIAEILEVGIQELNGYESHLEFLQEQKKGLMQKLLTGEVRVKVSEL